MKRFLLVSALALGAMTTVALAESVTPGGGQVGPVSLTSAQMDKITAGAYSRPDHANYHASSDVGVGNFTATSTYNSDYNSGNPDSQGGTHTGNGIMTAAYNRLK